MQIIFCPSLLKKKNEKGYSDIRFSWRPLWKALEPSYTIRPFFFSTTSHSRARGSIIHIELYEDESKHQPPFKFDTH